MKKDADDKEVRIKKEIATNFGSAATEYHEHAEVQKEAADRIIASLNPWKAILPAGPIIELGCGTGFVTKGLADLYPNREIEVTDLSEQMVALCRQKLSKRKDLSFSIIDAEILPHTDPYYALTVSGYTAHWFKDPALTLSRWMDATLPGGLLLASFPGNESFPQWREHCRALGLPFTANTLPDVEEVVIKMSVGPSQVDFYEDTVTQTFDSALDFFRHLKQIGSSIQKKGRSLTPKEYRLLINHWDSEADGAVTVHHHVVFLAVKKDL